LNRGFELPGLCEVRKDGNRDRQRFANLLNNALKYSPGGATVTIAVRDNLQRTLEPRVPCG
jgi:signal transduction histidine kinase